MVLRVCVSNRLVRTLWRAALTCAIVAACPALGAAQTTKTLSAPGTQLTDDVTIRGGGYANANLSGNDTLITKKSSDASNSRRILMKFDTANNVPANATISKATLVLTLKSAGGTSSRPLTVYRVSKSFLNNSATWNQYRSGNGWGNAGGDLSDKFATVNVGRTAGATVSFDVTDLVQKSVNNTWGTRYTRFAIVDTGGNDNESLRSFHSSRSATASARPKLVITYGSGSTSTPQTATGSGTTLKVMQYNTHHGVGTDGRYNLDRIATVIANQSPDVVTLNEVMYNSSYGNGENQPETYRRLLQQKTGRTWYYVYARMDGNWNSTSWAVGEMILSRYPFQTTTRYALSTGAHALAHATIVVNGRTINLFAVHPSWDNSSWRTTETKQTKSLAGNWAENRIVMGDFNTWPGTSDAQIMTSAYVDSWAAGVKAGIASSPSGSNGYTNGGSRFDYIYKSGGASNLSLKKIVVPNTSSGGAKPSDHDPLVATFAVN